MNTRIGVLLASIAVFILLFLAKITGVYVHIVLATVFCIFLVRHATKKREHSIRIYKGWKKINKIIWFLLILIISSGIAMAVESIYFYAHFVHKITSVLFLIFIFFHCKQHILYWKIKKGNI